MPRSPRSATRLPRCCLAIESLEDRSLPSGSSASVLLWPTDFGESLGEGYEDYGPQRAQISNTISIDPGPDFPYPGTYHWEGTAGGSVSGDSPRDTRPTATATVNVSAAATNEGLYGVLAYGEARVTTSWSDYVAVIDAPILDTQPFIRLTFSTSAEGNLNDFHNLQIGLFVTGGAQTAFYYSDARPGFESQSSSSLDDLVYDVPLSDTGGGTWEGAWSMVARAYLAVGGGEASGHGTITLVSATFLDGSTPKFVEYGDRVTDLETRPTAGVSLSGDQGVDYTYSVWNAEPPGGVPVSFLWATGQNLADAIPNLPAAYSTTLTGSDAAVGDHAKSLTWDQLTARPANATHLVMVLDPDDAVAEADEDNNFAWVALPPLAKVTLSVTANNDEAGNGDTVFGTYLPGVQLPTTFTVKVNDPDKVVASVKYSIDGGAAQVAPKAGTGWAFSRNMANYAAGEHPLVVTAYDASNQPVGTFPGTIVVGGQPDFELTVGGVEADKLRFINGVSTPVTFHGTVSGLPTFYDNKLQFSLGSSGKAVTVTRSQGAATFDVKYNVSALKAGLTAGKFLVGGVDVTHFGDAAEQVPSIDKPSWLTGGQWAFQNGSYVLTGVSPKLLSLNVAPQPLNIPGVDAIVAGKQTYAKFGLTFNALAPLDVDQAVTVNSFRVGADVTVLDKKVLKKSFLPAPNLVVTGTLDSEALTPKGLSAQMANPVTLFSGTLLKASGKVPVGPKVPGALGIDLAFGFQLAGTVTAKAGFALDTDANGVVVYDPANTFAQLTAQAVGHATVSVIGTFAEGLASLEATGTVDPTLTIDARVHFGGPVSTLPTVNTSLTGKLTGVYGFSVSAQLLFGAVDIPLFDTADDGTADDTFSFDLFKLTA